MLIFKLLNELGPTYLKHCLSLHSSQQVLLPVPSLQSSMVRLFQHLTHAYGIASVNMETRLGVSIDGTRLLVFWQQHSVSTLASRQSSRLAPHRTHCCNVIQMLPGHAAQGKDLPFTGRALVGSPTEACKMWSWSALSPHLIMKPRSYITSKLLNLQF